MPTTTPIKTGATAIVSQEKEQKKKNKSNVPTTSPKKMGATEIISREKEQKKKNKSNVPTTSPTKVGPTEIISREKELRQKKERHEKATANIRKKYADKLNKSKEPNQSSLKVTKNFSKRGRKKKVVKGEGNKITKKQKKKQNEKLLSQSKKSYDFETIDGKPSEFKKKTPEFYQQDIPKINKTIKKNVRKGQGRKNKTLKTSSKNKESLLQKKDLSGKYDMSKI